MSRSKLAAKNSIIGLMGQIISLIISLVIRKFFIVYLGVEILGISNTFASIISTLSLAELGFNTAITYYLYKPLEEKDLGLVCDILSIFRLVYRFVAGFILIVSIIVLPFIRSILKGIEVTGSIYVFFLLLVANTVLSYILAYKRTLLYADQKEYVSQYIDLATNFVFSFLKIMAIVLFKNYYTYLFIQIIQTVVSNLFVHMACKRMYDYFQLVKIDIVLLKRIISDVKDVFGSKLAYYINNSTDNLVISVFVGTVSVGFFTNYTTITSNIKRVIVSAFSPITPVVGNLLADDKSKHTKREEVCFLYTHVGFIISLLVLIPTRVLLNDFIESVFGHSFLLRDSITVLLVADIYINVVQRVCCDYINGAGLFKYDKYIEYSAATINIVVSLVLVKKLGILGCLIGTMISGLFFWGGRSLIAFKYCIGVNSNYLRYWFFNLIDAGVFIVVGYICRNVYTYLMFIPLFILRFIVGGVACEIVSIIIYFFLYYKTKRFANTKQLAKRIIQRRPEPLASHTGC